MRSALAALGLLTCTLALFAVPAPREGIRPRGRFIDKGDYIEDTKTGLLWQKDGDDSGRMNFYDAAAYAKKLRLGGLDGWRVPTRAELAGIFPAVDEPFKDSKYNPMPCCKGPFEWHSYWTSEPDPRLPDYAWVYHWYAKGGANNCTASANQCYVRCVRDGVKRNEPEN